MTERNIGRSCGERHVDLHIIVSRYAQTQTGLANGVQIGGFQILLTQMHTIRLVLNRQLPVIVNK
ncbi:hypothetical protein D3C77_763180 [compost metagenome]